jgi:hypothetical protein
MHCATNRMSDRGKPSASFDVIRRYIAGAVQDAPDLQHSDMHDIEDQVAADTMHRTPVPTLAVTVPPEGALQFVCGDRTGRR